MKKFCCVALLLSLAAAGQAQSVKGENFLNVGIGVGALGFYGSGIPLTASFEHGFTDKISAGGTFGYVGTNYTGWKYRNFLLGAKGSYHLNEVFNVSNDKLDTYAGLSIFYRGWSIKDDVYAGKTSGGGIDFAIHAGARYMFAEKVGGFAELGYGISALQLGVAFKF